MYFNKEAETMPREQIKELQEEKREISRFTVQQFIRKYGYEELYTKIQEVNKTLLWPSGFPESEPQKSVMTTSGLADMPR